jgi:hypothetical protein
MATMTMATILQKNETDNAMVMKRHQTDKMATKKRQTALDKVEEYFKMVDDEAETLYYRFDDPTHYTKTTDEKLLNDVIVACYKKYVYHYGDDIGDCDYDYCGDLIYSKTKCLHEVDMSQIVDLIYDWIDEYKYPTMLKMLGDNMKVKIAGFVAQHNIRFNKLLNERVAMYDKREHGTSRKYSLPLHKFKIKDHMSVNSWFAMSDAKKLRKKLCDEEWKREQQERKETAERYAMMRADDEAIKMRTITTFNNAMMDAINVAMNITDAEEKKRMMSALAVFGGYAPSLKR